MTAALLAKARAKATKCQRASDPREAAVWRRVADWIERNTEVHPDTVRMDALEQFPRAKIYNAQDIEYGSLREAIDGELLS